MKKTLLFVVAAATLMLSACNKKGKPVQDGWAFEEDSIYFVNDSTIADVILAVQTVNLNSDGTYTITTDYVDEGIATQSDKGDAMILLGVNDSTATILQLVSSNYNTPTVSFIMMEDSSLVKVDGDGNPVATKPEHKLNLKK